MIAPAMKQRSTKERNGATSGTRAVERALGLLRAVGDARVEPGLTELADALALHKTTVFRLLGALERAQFVVRDDERMSYHLGPALLHLATQARRATGLHDAARPELEALAAETGETATLEVLVGDEILILDEAHGRFLVGSTPEVGTRWPAYATSTGKVLLAAARFETPRASNGARHGPTGRLARLAPRTVTSRAALDRDLLKVWGDGYSVCIDELQPGFVAVGAPVRNAHARTVASVSVGGPQARLSGSRLALATAKVRRAAERISQRLGDPTTYDDIGSTTSSPTRPSHRTSGRARSSTARP